MRIDKQTQADYNRARVFHLISKEAPINRSEIAKQLGLSIGICGSDIHVYHGEHPFTSYPITQGHEVSGEIVELGKNVEGLEVG